VADGEPAAIDAGGRTGTATETATGPEPSGCWRPRGTRRGFRRRSTRRRRPRGAELIVCVHRGVSHRRRVCPPAFHLFPGVWPLDADALVWIGHGDRRPPANGVAAGRSGLWGMLPEARPCESHEVGRAVLTGLLERAGSSTPSPGYARLTWSGVRTAVERPCGRHWRVTLGEGASTVRLAGSRRESRGPTP